MMGRLKGYTLKSIRLIASDSRDESDTPTPPLPLPITTPLSPSPHHHPLPHQKITSTNPTKVGWFVEKDILS